MRAGKSTMKDVARAASVSIATVSFVLNEKHGMAIPQETRERVLNAVRELGYVRNAAGRHLASGKSHTLAFVLPAADHLRVDAFIPQILSSLNEVCHQNGFALLVHAIEDPSRPEAYADLVSANSIDGLYILNPRAEEKQIDALLDADFPVLVGPGWPHPKACGIGFSNREAAGKAVRHLIALGHRKIACINYGRQRFLTVASRYLGYRTALDEAGLPLDEGLVTWADFSHESGYRAAIELLDRGRSFTALFVGNDTVAIGALAALRERGRAVPGDVSVVGIDDIPSARYLCPPLTTVRVDAKEYGRRAGEMLISLVRGQRPDPARVYLDTELIVRESSAPAAP